MPRHNIKEPVNLTLPNAEFLPKVVELVNEGHSVTIKLKGFSMRPFLEDNRDKAVLVKPLCPKSGDAVLAEISKGYFVLHRIRSIDSDGNVVRLGEGNLSCEYCRIENVVAAAKGFYRQGRDKIDYTDGIKWKAYSFIWTKLTPIRRYLLAAYRRIWIPLFGPM